MWWASTGRPLLEQSSWEFAASELGLSSEILNFCCFFHFKIFCLLWLDILIYINNSLLSPNLPNYFQLVTLWQKMLVAAWGQKFQVLVAIGSKVLIKMCLDEVTAVVMFGRDKASARATCAVICLCICSVAGLRKQHCYKSLHAETEFCS